MNVYQHELGPSIDGDLICPKLFPDFAVSSTEAIEMLHTEIKGVLNGFSFERQLSE